MFEITRFQRFSVHDGPGIRTTVFLKGCSLRCFWCHNPEAVFSDIELWYSAEQCIGCGSCRAHCPKGLFFRESGCSCSGQTGFDCAKACPAGALSPTGFWMEEGLVLRQLLADSSCYRRTGGGVTFSGGEPLLQAQALRRLMESDALKGISKAVDTAGNVCWDAFREVLSGTDLFLYDVKCMDAVLHKEGTGADNRLIQENLEKLCGTGKEIWIRIPVIPGWNDTDWEMRAVARKLRELSELPQCGIRRIQLLPFHRFGKEKYARLGLKYPAENLAPPSEEKMEGLRALFRQEGLPNAEIGNHTVISGCE